MAANVFQGGQSAGILTLELPARRPVVEVPVVDPFLRQRDVTDRDRTLCYAGPGIDGALCRDSSAARPRQWLMSG
jgi:hypothetical protein